MRIALFLAFAATCSAATFGNTSIGANFNNGSANPLCTVYTAPANGTVTSISWYGRVQVAGSGAAAIYSDSGGAPNVVLAQSSVVSVPTVAGWNTFTLSQAITSGTPYWLCVTKDQNYDTQYDTGAANQSTYDVGTPGATFPSPWPGGSSFLNWAISIYATYTPSGGATVVPSHRRLTL